MEVDLDKISHNALTLVTRLRAKGISVTGVTKATLGSAEIANAWLRAGVCGLGDSRVENMQSMRDAQISAPLTLIRSPMISQVAQVVRLSDVSFNTEMDVICQLSLAAGKAQCIHGVVLMVELGDLREGIMPDQLEATVRAVLRLPNITFLGIGANLACRSGVSPDCQNMAELSSLADLIDATFGPIVNTVSGGNSANLEWALSGQDTGRINNLRLGEAMLLGCEPLHRRAIDGLHTNAITLVAEIIELKIKPSQPWGNLAQAAFGEAAPSADVGPIKQAILAIGRQDVDPDGLLTPLGMKILAASSDHLIVDVTHYRGPLQVGSEITFQLDYSALLRAMTSPFIKKVMKRTTINRAVTNV
ncbi:alanine/ornithine racemase family PLP-dependent enzyme [Persicirhabdus sediminis]|uniref:alanine/ornithine racemase family PLP-dependent enzyme n=1 Tax=Persicirhabdus sediminis TaxID=454144 RepID=UPI002D80D9FD|nr:alanine/ornithine racemase family PLP-dependent enzyme [Persicirhabdus sediminis]